jgi:hypothetical protein
MKRVSRMMVTATTLAALVLPTALYAGMLDPGAPPPTSGGTMRSLDELKPAWDQIIPGAPRFVNALDHTGVAFLDKETGLVWSSSIYYSDAWEAAMEYCTTLNSGGREGWRLPTIEELSSLLDGTVSTIFGGNAIPTGFPISNIYAFTPWWSSSVFSADASNAWTFSFTGSIAHMTKTNTSIVVGGTIFNMGTVCVRSGQQGP